MSSTKGTVLVTGANGGLGSAIVTNLLQKPELASNYTGLYTVRKAASATRLQGILKQAPESHKNVLDMDLSSLASVRTAAAEINRRVAAGELPPIKVLILNAAYQDHEQITMTDDGYETTWQVNFLANQLLALLLLQSMDKEKSRILIIGSWSHDIDDERNNLGGQACYQGYDSLFPGPDELARGKWSRPDTGGGWLTGFRRYGASKLCAVMLMHELVNRLAQDPQLSNITVTGLDPGAMASDLVRRGSFLMYQTIKLALPIISPLLVRFSPNGPYRPLYKSAEDAVQLAFEREAPKGRLLYLNGTDELETGKEARDDAKRKALWTYALQAADIKRGDTILQDWQ